jgi:hypothetical protein
VAALGFTIRREKNQETGGDLDWLLPLFPSLPAVRNTVTCNKRKTQAVVLFYFFLRSGSFGSVSQFFFLFLAAYGSEVRASVVELQRGRGG